MAPKVKFYRSYLPEQVPAKKFLFAGIVQADKFLFPEQFWQISCHLPEQVRPITSFKKGIHNANLNRPLIILVDAEATFIRQTFSASSDPIKRKKNIFLGASRNFNLFSCLRKNLKLKSTMEKLDFTDRSVVRQMLQVFSRGGRLCPLI